MSEANSLPNFDKLWNFGDPAATEAAFQKLLPLAEASGDASYLLQLRTQIARTFSLRRQFDECNAILDSVEQELSPDLVLVQVRLLLERGRSFNSAGSPERALPLFIEAYHLADSIQALRFAIDAVHMIAIAEPDKRRQIEWNLRGIAMVEANPEQKAWLWALYNNVGDAYAEISEWQTAHSIYQKLLKLQTELKGKPDIHTKKDDARALRHLGRPEQALEMMEPILDSLLRSGADDGWIREELAEDLEALGRHTEARPHFQKALDQLKDDDWVKQNDPAKLQQLKRMAGL